MLRRGPLAGLITVVAVVAGVVAVPVTEASASSVTAAQVLAGLPVAVPTPAGYERSLFPLWIDANGDGCDTREEVLKAESQVPVTISSGCTITGGQWYSPYDGATWTSPADVDIDHMVPLAEAWASGADGWTTAQRQAYANDLDFDGALIAVTDTVNQAKGDRDPAAWLPPLGSDWCAYATDWVLVKYRWRLTIDATERAALSNILTGSCGSATVALPAQASVPAPTPTPTPSGSAAGAFTPVAPARLLDTRDGTGGIRGPVPARTPIGVHVIGRAGVPATGVSAVVLNVTVTDPTGSGYVTAYPAGGATPGVSNLNFVTGQTVPNAVIVPVNSNGDIALFNGSWTGSVQLIADISGYYATGAPPAPGGLGTVTPTRLLDTRDGTGGIRGPIGLRTPIRVHVTGRAGVPAYGVAAVVLNVTATAPTGSGYVTGYSAGSATPVVSNLNFVAGQTVPNAVIVPVSPAGDIELFNGSWTGSVQLIADISGYFRAGAPTATGALGTVLPTRLLDTRDGTGGIRGPVPARTPIGVHVIGRAGVPATGVSAVVLNVTVTDPTGSGYVTAYPAGGATPGVSNLNFVTGQTVPNAVIVPVNSNGDIALFNGSWAGSVQLIADISGYYLAPPGLPAPANPGDSKNCSDFPTWSAAQAWFDYYYPYYGDIARLDGDNNGIACQSLPGAP